MACVVLAFRMRMRTLCLEMRLTEQKLLSLVLSLSVEHLSANLSLSYFREEEEREYYKKE